MLIFHKGQYSPLKWVYKRVFAITRNGELAVIATRLPREERIERKILANK